MSENEPDTTDTPQNEKETTKQTAPAKQAPEQPKKKAASARRTSRTFDQADKLKNVFYDIRGRSPRRLSAWSPRATPSSS